MKYKKDQFYSRNRQLEHRFKDGKKQKNLIIYAKKDSKTLHEQTKSIRKSFQNQKNSWKTDLVSNNSQHEIIKNIISSTTHESSKRNPVPSDRHIQNTYFPVKSLTTHFINASDVFSNHYTRPAEPTAPGKTLTKAKTLTGPVKTISRSLPRSPMKHSKKARVRDSSEKPAQRKNPFGSGEQSDHAKRGK